MPESLFDRYVLAGGWAMTLLIPASIVTAAVVLRCVAMMRSGEVRRIGHELRLELEARRTAGTNFSDSDAREAAYDKALDIFGAIQPLSIVYGLAPLVGALGSLTSLSAAHRRYAAAGDLMRLADAVQNAMVPTAWGIGIALFAYSGYALLRARLFYLESKVWVPAALARIQEQPVKPVVKKLQDKQR